MCDVTNPLYGENGAAYVFAPQKGADDAMVKRLDQGLRHAADVLERAFSVEIAGLPGSGAAGGCGAGARLFLSSELKSGIDVVLDVKGFDSELKGAKYVITGEGKFDSQSLGGKAISGIAKRCAKNGTPLIVLAGCAAEDETCYELGVTAVFSIQRKAVPLEEAKLINDISLYRTALNVAKLIFCNLK
jgi:glycerate kinase